MANLPYGTLYRYPRRDEKPKTFLSISPWAIRSCVFLAAMTCFLMNWSLTQIFIRSFGLGLVIAFTCSENAFILRAHVEALAKLACLVIPLFFILHQFELSKPPAYELDTTDVDFTRPFYRMHNPRHVHYHGIMDTLEKQWNGAQVQKTTMGQVGVLMKSNLGSDPLRFEFLQQYWNSLEDDKSPYVCIIESDVLFNITCMQDILEHSTAEVIAIQHQPEGRAFEPINYGILCTRRQVSWRTRVYVDLMRRILKSRFRRMILRHYLFYYLVPKSSILYWDEYYGCETFAPHCQYVHFSHPKNPKMQQALALLKIMHDS